MPSVDKQPRAEAEKLCEYRRVHQLEIWRYDDGSISITQEYEDGSEQSVLVQSSQFEWLLESLREAFASK
jgi:hypothetical protein